MKKVLMVLVMVSICAVAMASDTGRGEYTTPAPWLTDYLNNNNGFYHTHDYNEYKNPMGLGLDITVYEFEGKINEWGLDSLEVQQKWDMNNNTYELFGVCKANLWTVVKKFIKK